MSEVKIDEYAHTPAELAAGFLVEVPPAFGGFQYEVQDGKLRIIASKEQQDMAWRKINGRYTQLKASGRDNAESAAAALNSQEVSFAELVAAVTSRSREMQLKIPATELRWALFNKALSLEFAMRHRREALLRGRNVPESAVFGTLSSGDLASSAISLQKFQRQLFYTRKEGLPPAARR